MNVNQMVKIVKSEPTKKLVKMSTKLAEYAYGKGNANPETVKNVARIMHIGAQTYTTRALLLGIVIGAGYTYATLNYPRRKKYATL